MERIVEGKDDILGVYDRLLDRQGLRVKVRLLSPGGWGD